jgi:diphthamide biosynthesis protein 7
MSARHPQSAITVFLDQPPSCLQFCPACPDYFVVGTYLLTETKDENGDIQQTKTGSLQLWHLDPVQKTLSEDPKKIPTVSDQMLTTPQIPNPKTRSALCSL